MKKVVELRDMAIYKEFSRRGSRKIRVQMTDHFNSEDYNEKPQILAYLKSGHMFHGWMQMVWDHFDKKNGFAVSDSLLTDGCWSWTNDLSYYVEKYDLILPAVFVEHMQSRNWEILNLDELKDTFQFNADTFILCRSNWYEEVSEQDYIYTKNTHS